MPRRMKDPVFRAEQHARLHEPHIAAITSYVDSLRARSGRWLPYVAPLHAGATARVLTVLRDPGPKTQESGGSGMLCVENDDQTAESQFGLMEQAGMMPADFTPWNAYPWYINNAPSDEEIAEAAPTLLGLVELLPDLEVVFLQGSDASSAWRVAVDAEPAIRRRQLVAFETYHPSARALQTNKPGERERRIEHRLKTWRDVGDWLRR
jgi:hypothetical protein